MQGPALSRRCRALKVLSPSAWAISRRAAVPSLVGNIAASIRSPHQYPCVHPSRRIPRKGHGQQRDGWVLTTPEASPHSFLSPRPGHYLPAWMSLSPNLPCCGLGRPRRVTPLGARRSCPSSITSRQLRRSGPAWRAGPVKDWLDGIGLAARHDARRHAPWWPADPRRLAGRGQGPRRSSARRVKHRRGTRTL